MESLWCRSFLCSPPLKSGTCKKRLSLSVSMVFRFYLGIGPDRRKKSQGFQRERRLAANQVRETTHPLTLSQIIEFSWGGGERVRVIGLILRAIEFVYLKELMD